MLFISHESSVRFISQVFVPIFLVKENGLIRKLKFNSKFVTPQTGKKITAIDILPNISRSKWNQTMIFGQLIKYNIRNIFL